MTVIAESRAGTTADESYVEANDGDLRRPSSGKGRVSGLFGLISRPNESTLVSALALTVYSVVAVLLDFEFHLYPGDAVSRMANGFYVLYSRFPHLAAIGFVWNPLTSILDMVPLLFKDLWPALTTNDVAGSLTSIICMTVAVHQLRSALGESGVSRWPRLTLTAIFALNPMILYYAGNGMSEAVYLATALATCRYLQRWFRADDVRSLVYAGTALALCYLAREEAAAIAVASGGLVLVKGFRTTRGSWREKMYPALTDATTYLLPFIATFVVWAAAGYIITGQAFSQFTSQYGNSNQLRLFNSSSGMPTGEHLTRLLHEGTALEYLAPFLPLILLWAMIGAHRFHDWQYLAPIFVLGGGVGFTMLSYLDNQIFPWFRFYILTIPLEVLAVGAIISAGTRSGIGPAWSIEDTKRVTSRRKRRRISLGFITLGSMATALLLAGPSLFTTAAGMFNPNFGIEEASVLGFLTHSPGAETTAQREEPIPMLTYVDKMKIPDGSILLDNTLDCAVTTVVSADNPKVFVIPNDPDYKRILADPLTFHTRYILVPKPESGQFGLVVNETYPALYWNGAGFAVRVKSFGETPLCPPYRLYRVVGHPSSAGGSTT